MFYKQSMNNVEMVILCLDGGLLDLNRLRYNYFNRICKQYNHSISKEEFTATLGNSKTMYTQLPIQEALKDKDINEIIEKDLYEYAKLKQNIKKDGVDELLQFFNQKKIKVAVISTHKTKRAIQYLQLTRIYQYVDFVIGGDSQHSPLPDSSILHTICTQMNVAKENTVVVANFPSLVEAASELFMNVIYMQDLVPATTSIHASVYKTVKNNLEMINVFLFSKYDTVEMYSSVLGMSKEMDVVTLEKTYQRLLVEYQDDIQLIALVKRAYHFFLMEINNEVLENKKTISLDTIPNFKAKEEMDSNKIKESDAFSNKMEEILKKEKEEEDISISIAKSNLETNEVLLSSKELEDSLTTTSINIPKSFEQEATIISDLMNKINKSSIKESKDSEDITDDDEIENEWESHRIIEKVLDFVYVLIMTFIISIVGMVVYMVVGDYLQSKGIITSIINTGIHFYTAVIRGVYMFLFDMMHAISGVIPGYQSLLKGNEFISSLAIEVMMFTIFNVLIYYGIRELYHFINKGRGTID